MTQQVSATDLYQTALFNMFDDLRFHVNLNLGGDIAFHFNPRFRENCIVRNTKTGGKWGSEERQGSGLPFMPGSMFDLKILVEPNCYKVSETVA